MQNNGAIQAGFDNTTTDVVGLKSPCASAINTWQS